VDLVSILQSEDEIVAVFGEEDRELVHRALAYLDANEPLWGVKLDRLAYVADLMKYRRRRLEADGC
jgi:hypothetical protein